MRTHKYHIYTIETHNIHTYKKYISPCVAIHETIRQWGHKQSHGSKNGDNSNGGHLIGGTKASLVIDGAIPYALS